jgi:hypothetical protein
MLLLSQPLFCLFNFFPGCAFGDVEDQHNILGVDYQSDKMGTPTRGVVIKMHGLQVFCKNKMP